MLWGEMLPASLSVPIVAEQCDLRGCVKCISPGRSGLLRELRDSCTLDVMLENFALVSSLGKPLFWVSCCYLVNYPKA